MVRGAAEVLLGVIQIIGVTSTRALALEQCQCRLLYDTASI